MATLMTRIRKVGGSPLFSRHHCRKCLNSDMNLRIRMAVLAFAGFLLASPAHAGYVLMTFTGTGVNGAVAWGKFTVGDTALVPNYYAPGSIYGSFSMTISNIP